MIVVDSEFESLISPLTDDEYQRLERSILAEGVRDPIITWNGTIIDGHNRYRICEEHGIEFKQTEREFASRDAAKIWIIENQLGRRNLSKYDRSVLALKLEGMYAEEAQKRKQATQFGSTVPQISAEPTSKGETRDKVAKAAGVSHDTIRKVKVIEAEAAKGNPTAIKAREDVRTGKKSINKAHQSVRPNGDKSDTRIICEVCGKPIDKGDSYDHDKKKHKACSYELEKKRKSRQKPQKPKFTEDGRRICLLCGEPIEPGEHFQDKLNWCKKCGRPHETEMQRKYRDADRDLRENVPVYNIDSLVMELTASVTNMRDAVTQSIEINESMGVKLTSRQKDSLNKAIEKVLQTIERMKG